MRARRAIAFGSWPLKLIVSWHQMNERFRPGAATWVASDSALSDFSGIFEDDGDTGYFYAHDRRPGAGILDAVLIYHVANLRDRDRESDAEIRWSSDGLKVGLFFNGQLHALIDFDSRVAYGRTNSPPPGGPWAAPTRALWRDDLIKLLT